jgi:hypothetical protein
MAGGVIPAGTRSLGRALRRITTGLIPYLAFAPDPGDAGERTASCPIDRSKTQPNFVGCWKQRSSLRQISISPSCFAISSRKRDR